MTINLALVQVYISSRHSNLNFAHHFCYLLIVPKWRELQNQHQDSYQRETVPDKFVFLSKLVRQKIVKRGSKKTCIYVSEICAEGIFVTFPW